MELEEIKKRVESGDIRLSDALARALPKLHGLVTDDVLIWCSNELQGYTNGLDYYQRRYTDLLLTIAMLPSLGIDQLRMPYATQSLARYELRHARAEVRTSLASRSLDVGTRAHLEELGSRIDRGLSAQNVRGI